jgi:hypothetical protein
MTGSTPQPTALTLASSPNPTTLGHSVTLVATVTPSAATGKVTFYDGTTVLGIATVSSGQATLTTILLPFGHRSLKAFYGGDSTYATSSSATLTEVVTAQPENALLAQTAYPVGSFPAAVAMGDFNGDGKVDLVVVVQGSLNLLLGNGDGTFQAARVITDANANGSNTGLAVADFNGDGKLDLVVGDANSGAVILLGNGDGSFQQPVGIGVTASPNWLVTADFNGDGAADLAAIDQNGFLRIMLGNGDGTFRHGDDLAIPHDGLGLAIGDFNGDGHADLAINLGEALGHFIIGKRRRDLSSSFKLLRRVRHSCGGRLQW